VLFLCGAKLVLRSSVLIVLDFVGVGTCHVGGCWDLWVGAVWRR
jgi:hypothetical protein